MRFDVIIGNPPYQLSDGGDSTGSSPIYQYFVENAKKLNPRYLIMIIPSRWFAGGKGLDEFRSTMLNDNRISHLVDYPIARDVFDGIKLNGGVCYFLLDQSYHGECLVTTHMKNLNDTAMRPLNQFDIFVRFNKAISILEKIKKQNHQPLSNIVSRQKPFGLRTFEKPTNKGDITLYANNEIGKIEISDIRASHDIIPKWKLLISRGYGEGGEGRDYPRTVIGKPIIAPPQSACTETYLVIGAYDSEIEAKNLERYIKSRFLRFLVCLRKNTQDTNKDRFDFVPLLPMTEVWDDIRLYAHFELTQDEIDFIEKLIRPMG